MLDTRYQPMDASLISTFGDNSYSEMPGVNFASIGNKNLSAVNQSSMGSDGGSLSESAKKFLGYQSFSREYLNKIKSIF